MKKVKGGEQPTTLDTLVIILLQMPSTTPKKSLWSDLPRRMATICIGFPVVWKILSNEKLSLIFFVCVHGLVGWEFSFLEPKEEKPKHLPTTNLRLTFCLVSLSVAMMPIDSLFHLVLCASVGILTWLERRHWILGLVFITIPFRTWYFISQDFASTISILLVVWNCDSGALVVGRLASKSGIPRIPVPSWIHKISPAKSMEGFVGGLAGGTWTAVSWIPRLVSWFEIDTSESFEVLWSTSLSHRFALGLAMSVMAIFGDLVESSIKRQSQTKDSGSILPGHGGILDRFDSSLFAVLLYSFVRDMVKSNDWDPYCFLGNTKECLPLTLFLLHSRIATWSKSRKFTLKKGSWKVKSRRHTLMWFGAEKKRGHSNNQNHLYNLLPLKDIKKFLNYEAMAMLE